MPDGNTRTTEIHWETIIRRDDPDFYRERRKEIEYEFTRRTFFADGSTRGLYGPEPTNLSYLIDSTGSAFVTDGEQRIAFV